MAALMLTASGCGKKSSAELASGENTDSPYPYTWKEQNNGSYVIEITGDLPEDVRWSAISDSTAVEVTEKAPCFTISPETEGTAAVIISMLKDNLPVEAGTYFYFGFAVDETGAMTLEYTYTETVEAEAHAAGTETLTWKQSGNGSLFLYISGENWSFGKCKNMAGVGPVKEDGACKFEVFFTGEEKNGSVIISDEAAGVAWLLELSTDGEEISVNSCSEAEIKTVTTGTEENGQEELRQAAIEYLTGVNGTEPTEEEIQALLDELAGEN